MGVCLAWNVLMQQQEDFCGCARLHMRERRVAGTYGHRRQAELVTGETANFLISPRCQIAWRYSAATPQKLCFSGVLAQASLGSLAYQSIFDTAGKRYTMMETVELLFEKRPPSRSVVGRWEQRPLLTSSLLYMSISVSQTHSSTVNVSRRTAGGTGTSGSCSLPCCLPLVRTLPFPDLCITTSKESGS